MEAADITTWIERCAPSALTRPVAAIMRQASASDALLVTIAGKRPIRVLAASKPEAIALTSEAAATGQPVRIGLAQLDAQDLKTAGLTVTAAFDPCAHIAGVGRVFQERRARLTARGVPESVAGEQAVASFTSERVVQTSQADIKHGVTTEPAKESVLPQEDIASAKDPPPWNVYGSRRRSSLLVYGR